MSAWTNTRKVQLLIYTKMAMVVFYIVSYFLCVGIFLLFEHKEGWKWETKKVYLIEVVIGFGSIVAMKIFILVLLIRALNQRSISKTLAWLVLNGSLLFVICLIAFLATALDGKEWTLSLLATMTFLTYDLIALKVVYDFMVEIRTVRKNGNILFVQLRDEAV